MSVPRDWMDWMDEPLRPATPEDVPVVRVPLPDGSTAVVLDVPGHAMPGRPADEMWRPLLGVEPPT